MISAKVLSIAAAMTLLLPALAPTASFAQKPGVARGGGGGGARVGGGGGPHFGGGAPAARFGGNSGGGAPAARFGGGGGYRRGNGGFIPGAVAGAVVGGAIAAAPYGYGGPGYYAPGYYDDQYYDDGPVVVAPAQGGGDDAVAYCMQTYRSYDPRSGTYLGNDGYRHPCP